MICALFALAIVLLWQRRRRLPGDGFGLLVGSLGASIAAELLFTLYVGPHTWPNLAGPPLPRPFGHPRVPGVVEDGWRGLTLAVESLHEAQSLHDASS